MTLTTEKEDESSGKTVQIFPLGDISRLLSNCFVQIITTAPNKQYCGC